MMAQRNYTIGRERSCSLVITGKDSEQVSRKHAEIIINPSKDLPMLVDLNSQNGTYILRNNEFHKIKQCYMREGDVFRFGNYKASGQEIFKILGINLKERIKRRKNAQQGKAKKGKKNEHLFSKKPIHHHHHKVVVPVNAVQNNVLIELANNLKNRPILSFFILIIIVTLMFFIYLDSDKFKALISIF